MTWIAAIADRFRRLMDGAGPVGDSVAAAGYDPAAAPLPSLNTLYAPSFEGLRLKKRPEIARATQSVVVAILPRSGSSMFSSLLARTGALGFPDEYLNDGGPMAYHARKLGTDSFDTHWDTLLRVKKTSNGVFGLKTDYRQLLPLIERGLVDEMLPRARFIYLTRSDLLGQAVSLQRAQSTGLWHLDHDGKPLGSSACADPVYDEARITGFLRHLERMQADWTAYFARRRIKPLHLTYERIVADPKGAMERCLRFCNVRPAVDLRTLTPDMTKIADAVNDDWCRRYRLETGWKPRT